MKSPLAWKPLRRLAKRVLRRPRLRCWGVGAPKTGTTSVVKMVQPALRADHEPEFRELVAAIVAAGRRNLDGPEFDRVVRNIAYDYNLEFHISSPLAFVVAPLVRVFPTSRFLFTVRQPRPWVESVLAHLTSQDHNHAGEKIWLTLDRAVRWYHDDQGQPWPRQPWDDEVLAPRGFHAPLEGYIQHWAWYVNRVLDVVPHDRLLVLWTEDLNRQSAALASFLNLRPDQVHPVHANRSVEHWKKQSRPLLPDLDQDKLTAMMDRICGPALARLAALPASVAPPAPPAPSAPPAEVV